MTIGDIVSIVCLTVLALYAAWLANRAHKRNTRLKLVQVLTEEQIDGDEINNILLTWDNGDY